MIPAAVPDREINAVAAALRALDPGGTRTARVLRETLDQLYDGQRTGRYRWDQLFKTEKTHCGTLVEINFHREFKFEDGVLLDYRVADIEVDCKYSQKLGGWMIPPEAQDQLCLLVSAEDSEHPLWNMGLVRASKIHLNLGTNRDSKATLNKAGRESIFWLFRDEPLPANILLQIDRVVVDKILSHKSGQKRINELFRAALGRIVGRAAVATVAQQDDYMKRLRQNGGARTALKSEGIIILGQYRNHVRVARELGIPIPGPGDSISIRVAQTQFPGGGVAEISGGLWTVASPGSPIVPAPDLPKI